MKTAYLILSLIGSVTFGPRIAYAVGPGQASQQAPVDGAGSLTSRSQATDHVASGERPTLQGTVSTRRQNRSNPTGKNPGLSWGVLRTTGRFNRVHNNGENTATAGGGAREAGAQNGSNAHIARSPTLVRPMAPALNVPHRAPNPAIVNGSFNPAHRSTGAINGTRMNRFLRNQSR